MHKEIINGIEYWIEKIAIVIPSGVLTPVGGKVCGKIPNNNLLASMLKSKQWVLQSYGLQINPSLVDFANTNRFWVHASSTPLGGYCRYGGSEGHKLVNYTNRKIDLSESSVPVNSLEMEYEIYPSGGQNISFAATFELFAIIPITESISV